MNTPAGDKEEPKPLECGEWDARHERRTGKPPILTVTGECKLPTTYRAVLKPHEPQEDPEVLVLDLQVSLPSQPATEVKYSEPFLKLYQERPAAIYITYRVETETEYKTVTILNANSGEVMKSGLRVKTISSR
jgi:hypothetical protein